jgi:hypothetical protein
VIDEVVLDRLSPKEIVAREHATGVPLFYRLNADATVAARSDLAAGARAGAGRGAWRELIAATGHFTWRRTEV